MKFNKKSLFIVLSILFLFSMTAFACSTNEKVYEPTSIVLNCDEDKLSLNVGESFDMVVADKTHFKDGIIYSSSDDKIASVSANGKITAVASGDCVVTVSSGSLKKEISVSVVAPSEYVVLLDRLNCKIGAGSEIDVNASVYSNGVLTDEVAQWSVDITDTSKIELTSDGNKVVVYAKQAGKYRITATAKGRRLRLK